MTLRPGNPIHRQARIAAIDEARRRAADYAAAFDATLGSLLEVSDLDGSFAHQPRALKAAFAMDAGGMRRSASFAKSTAPDDRSSMNATGATVWNCGAEAAEG